MRNIYLRFISMILTAVIISSSMVSTCYGKGLNVDAGSAIAIDGNSGRVVYEKNAYSSVAIASTTKIITALVALNYGNLDEEFVISKNAACIRGSAVGYKENEKITLHELLYGLMFKSGNDAAIAIAEGISGSVEEFCKLMNEHCLEIGLINSHFESPHGLDSMYHYSTAYDLAMATKKAKENPKFQEIVSSKSISKDQYNFTRDYQNINKLLYQMPNANGVKTGYTGKAGKCLVSSVNMDGGDIIIVTLNCTPRWEETKKIFNYVKENYEYKKLFSKGESVKKIDIEDGKEPLELSVDKDINMLAKKGEELKVEIKAPNTLKAPVNKDEMVGSIVISDEKEQLLCEPLITNNHVNKKPFYQILKEKVFD